MFFNSKKKEEGEFEVQTIEQNVKLREVIDTGKSNHSSANKEEAKQALPQRTVKQV